jgi:hypothetical protein
LISGLEAKFLSANAMSVASSFENPERAILKKKLTIPEISYILQGDNFKRYTLICGIVWQR